MDVYLFAAFLAGYRLAELTLALGKVITAFIFKKKKSIWTSFDGALLEM